MLERIQFKPLSLLLAEQAFKDMRMYEGKPSVTTVLKILRDSEEFEKFKAVDMDRYKAMLKSKAGLGTMLHHCIEETYSTGKFKSPPTQHAQARMKFYVREGHLWKPKHLETFLACDNVAGTCDAIFQEEQGLCLTDWKSVGAKIYDELMFKNKMQVAKYAQMYNSTHPDKVTSGRIVAFSKDGWYRIIPFTDIDYYAGLYDQVLAEFISLREQYNEAQGGTSGVQESCIQGHGQVIDSDNQVSINQIVNDIRLGD